MKILYLKQGFKQMYNTFSNLGLRSKAIQANPFWNLIKELFNLMDLSSKEMYALIAGLITAITAENKIAYLIQY